MVVLLLVEICQIQLQKPLVILTIKVAIIELFIYHKARWGHIKCNPSIAIESLELGRIDPFYYISRDLSNKSSFKTLSAVRESPVYKEAHVVA